MPAPDLIVTPRAGYDIKTWNRPTVGKIKVTKNTTTQTGCHKDKQSRRGIFIFENKEKMDLRKSQYDIYDVCPTIMYLYDLLDTQIFDGVNIIQ
jgi:predicted AlkP superfamily phosphohydrolase/phosphomutase